MSPAASKGPGGAPGSKAIPSFGLDPLAWGSAVGILTRTMPHIEKPYQHHEKFSEDIASAIKFVWNPVTRVFGRPCSWLIRTTDELWHYCVPGLLILTVLIVTWDVALYIGNSQDLDWLWVTSYPFGLFVLFRSTDLPDRIFYLRKSLVNQRILEQFQFTLVRNLLR